MYFLSSSSLCEGGSLPSTLYINYKIHVCKYICIYQFYSKCIHRIKAFLGQCLSSFLLCEGHYPPPSTYVCIYKCICIYMYVCIYFYSYMYMFIYLNIYMYVFLILIFAMRRPLPSTLYICMHL
jgi:hypothetical protein